MNEVQNQAGFLYITSKNELITHCFYCSLNNLKKKIKKNEFDEYQKLKLKMKTSIFQIQSSKKLHRNSISFKPIKNIF